MKITGYELFKVPPRWLFLKVTTDEGIDGWGEPIVESKPDTTAAAVRESFDLVLGKDPAPIEDHVNVLLRSGFYRHGPVINSAIAGIEQALWDIKGKALGVPIHQLLGGPVRNTIRMYGWIGGEMYKTTDAEIRKQAKDIVARGYTAMKMNVCGPTGMLGTYADIDAVAARAAAVRETIGPELDFAIDFHGRVHRALAKQLLKVLEPMRPLFVEEAVLPEHSELFPELAAGTTIPLAAGERLFSRWDFKRVLGPGGLAIVQPDLSHALGIWECRKIAAMAEAYDVAIAPHCPLGPINLAASLQLDACCPNFLIQEQSELIHYNKGGTLTGYLKDPETLTAKDGYLPVPTAPGLGIEIDEDKVRAATQHTHTFQPTIWRLKDGTYAEW